MTVSDLRSPIRVKDRDLLKRLHREWKECVLCLETFRLSLHHIHNKPRNDVEANLVMLCGDGTTGCHGMITIRDHVTSLQLGRYILASRPDTISYLLETLGGPVLVEDWMRRQYGVYPQM